MSLAQKTLGLGQYEPTRAYSFEFIDRKSGKIITEIFLLVPPTEYSMNYGYRINVTPTLAGAKIDDFGNDFKKMSYHFDIWFYWMDDPLTEAPSAASDSLSGGFQNLANKALSDVKSAGKSALASIGLYDMLSGLDEFFRLRYMLGEGRDKSLLDENDAWVHPMEGDFEKEKRFKKTGIDQLVNEAYYNHLNLSDIQIVFHDYDDQHHYEVVMEQFKLRRSKDDPWSFSLDIDMLGLKPVYGRPNVTGDIESLANPADVFSNFAKALSRFTGVLDNFLNAISNVVELAAQVVFFKEKFMEEINRITSNLGTKWERIKNRIKEMKSYLFGEDSNNSSGNQNQNSNTRTKSIFSAIEAAAFYDNNGESSYVPPYETLGALYDLKESFISFEAAVISVEQYVQDILQKDGVVLSDIDLANLVQAGKYFLHTVVQGESVYSISNLYFGSISKANIICDRNNLTPSDFADNKLVGQEIKIPLESVQQGNTVLNNHVFSGTADLLGSDIHTIDKKIMLDQNGDMDVLSGTDGWIANIQDRLENSEGSLNELYPGWGLIQLVGNMISSVLVDKMKQNIISQALKDPRTKKAVIKDVVLKQDECFFLLGLECIDGTTKDQKIPIAG